MAQAVSDLDVGDVQSGSAAGAEAAVGRQADLCVDPLPQSVEEDGFEGGQGVLVDGGQGVLVDGDGDVELTAEGAGKLALRVTMSLAFPSWSAAGWKISISQLNAVMCPT